MGVGRRGLGGGSHLLAAPLNAAEPGQGKLLVRTNISKTKGVPSFGVCLFFKLLVRFKSLAPFPLEAGVCVGGGVLVVC